MKKIYLILSLIFSLSYTIKSNSLNICTPTNNEVKTKAQEKKEALIQSFKPDFYITTQTEKDIEILDKMKDLFYEADGSAGKTKEDVYKKAITKYGAQEIMLLTEDNFRISSLYFKRKEAPINLICVTGYFHDLTPPKEWPTCFSVLFPNFNILSFDWRGFGSSDGKKGKFTSNDFGANAYPDIQAAVDFLRKENDKPIVVMGFCFGAAMVLKATTQAIAKNKNKPDAIVLDSIFTTFENQFNRSAIAEDRTLRRIFMQTSNIFVVAILNSILNGSLFNLKPIELIEQVNIPTYFVHFTNDPFAIIEEGIEVFEKAKTFKMFLRSDLGRHVRTHSKVPYQYKNCFYKFLLTSKLLNINDFYTLCQKESIEAC